MNRSQALTSRLALLATGASLLLVACTTQESTAPTPHEPEAEAQPEAEPMSETQTPVDPVLAQLQQFAEDSGVDTGKPSWRTSLPQPPKAEFAGDTTYFWDLKTTEGPIRVRLFSADAPMHVTSTIYLTQLGFYDGLKFHRVIPGFMAQGGCPLGTGTGGPGYKYAGEFGSQRHDRPGLLSMANAGPNTDGSQFFLTFVPTPHLDGRHTIFGEVVAGMETLKKLETFGSGGSGRTTKPLVIEKAEITVE